MTSPGYASVAIFRPIRSTFEYSVPGQLKEEVSPGSICRLPFRGEYVRGIVLEVREEPGYEGEQKQITEVISDDPLPDSIIHLAEWLSFTTLTPIGQVLNRFIPGDLSVRPRTKDRVELTTSFDKVRSFIEGNKKRAPKQVELLEYLLALDGKIEKTELLDRANSSRSPLKALVEKEMVEISSLPVMASSGAEVSAKISPPLEPDWEFRKKLDFQYDEYSQYAVNGTGSQRLETYLGIIRDLKGTGTVLILAPNVVRAEELTGIVRNELDRIVLPYHSNLTDGEISASWNLARAGEVDVFVGVLNAIYLLVPRLRGIIVEGEGERNYELTEQDPKGNLVETARKRAKLQKVPLVLGGPGPSIQTYYQVKAGKLETIDDNFPDEFKKSVDMTLEDPGRDDGDRALSSGLMRALKWSYNEEGPALIVGGKSGTSGAAFCDDCGTVVRCSDCEVPLTFTGSGNYGVCPYCGTKTNLLVCDSCGSDELKFIGSGLEKAEAEVRSLLPGAEVRRFDFKEDTREEFLKLAFDVLNGEVDVVIGTKIVESLYFQGRSSLVGLLDLDLINNRPSYRSTEFLFRRVLSGLDMAKDEGKVFLQARRDRGGVFDLIKARHWKELYKSELKSRQRMGYPPFKRLIKIEVEGSEEEEARDAALKLKEALAAAGGDCQLLGPTSNSFGKRKGRYQSDLIVKTEDSGTVLDRINSIVSDGGYEEVRVNPFA